MKPLFTVILIMSTLFSSLFGQSYSQLWDKVNTAERKDLPRDVVTHAQSIYDKASKEKNFPQLLKSWVKIVETKCNLDPDSFQLANFPPLPHKGQVQTALYNAIMGQAYLVMTDTHISDYDVETQELYSNKARELFALALSDKEALANASTEDYEPLVTQGKDSHYYGHDMLSLLTRFTMEHSRMTRGEQALLCAEVAEYYKQHGKMEGYTLMVLVRLGLLKNHEDFNQRLYSSDYKAALKTLLDETKEMETGVDVAEEYIDQIYDEDEKIDFARWAQKQYKHTSRISKFESIEKKILHTSLSIYSEQGGLANRPNRVTIQGKNITAASFEVRQYNGKTKKNELKTDGKVVLSRQYQLCDDSLNVARRQKGYATNGERTDSITLPAGHYVYIARQGSETDIAEVQITSLRLLTFNLPDNKVMAQVVDNETGRPVSGALLSFQDYQNKVHKTLTCDKNGECIFDNEKSNLRLCASIPGTDDETGFVDLRQWSNEQQKNRQTVVKLYTDRGIYRPGQTVHVYGFAYVQDGDEVQAEAGWFNSVEIKDAFWNILARETVESNALGSFDFDFVLPKDILPGQVTLSCSNSTASIRVEEYKRPTFQVDARAAEVDAEHASFSFGDTIQVEAVAKAFSGVPVQGAQVHYKVESSEVSFWRWFDTNWNTLSQGDTISDETGLSRVPVFLNPQDLKNDMYGAVRYRITFDVTDQAGETQSAIYYLSVSTRTFALQIYAGKKIDLSRDDQQFMIKAINANRADVSVSGTFSLYNIVTRQTVLDTKFDSNKPISLPTDLQPGSYRIDAMALDRDGVEISCSQQIEVYNSQSAINIRPVSTLKNGKTANSLETRFSNDFIQVTQSTFSEEQAGQLIFSPVEDDVFVNYMILSNSEIVERKQLEIDRRQYSLSVPYNKKFGDGVSVLIWYVRNGHLCQERVEFIYQRPEKRLKLSWSTFRDKLYPGQEEEWTLTIHDYNDKPVNGAELLATMYDASLDQIEPHDWYFGLNFQRIIRRWNYRNTSSNSGTSLHCEENVNIRRNATRNYDELTQYLHDRYARFYGFTGGSRHLMRSKDALYAMDAAPMVETHSFSMAVGMVSPSIQMEEEAEANHIAEDIALPGTDDTQTEAPVIRSNFAETAFFYPHLLSDKNGDVKISFTLPESLTEWKFMGLAHTTDVNYGQITSSAVAHKDFMVQPNMPRFVREGDQVVISARVINQGETDLNGKAQMRLIDPETEQVVFTTTQAFSVAQGQTCSVSFQANITDQYPILICEVSGTSGSFSDGERNYLPVLSSKKYMTEAIPFWITDQDKEKTIDVSSLFNEGSATATHRRLLLEFTEHPEWNVIEALDGIKLPEHDNAPCFAASLYANTMAARLAASIPGFEKALTWAKEHNIDATSPLQDNQDLKEIILKDSPWVRDAMAEAEQRNRLLDLFDSERMNQRLTKAKEKLQKLQLSDGSWSWFEGMEGSYYITLSTCLNLAMLQSEDIEVQSMLERGLKFLDKKEYQNYLERKKNKWPLYASSSLEYLYVCSYLADRKVDKDIEKMREVYLKEIEKEVRDFTIQGRSKAACVLRAFGHDKAADEFLESAVQYTITKPGMGRYYATDAAYYSWCDYRIPTQLAAMRALRQSSRADRTELINEMQLWLIRQKQSQGWDSPINTIGAVDFLLNSQYAPAGQQTQAASSHTFMLDGKALPAQIDSTKFLAEQLGYIRTELNQQLYGQQLDHLVVSAPSSEGAQPSLIAWGALYAQYLEDMDRLKQQSTGELKVSVKLIKSNGNTSQPATSLQVGDEVTLRVIVTADRDLDFVQIRMQRPACFEPTNQLSGYRWMNGRGGYVAQHDASTDIFFDTFRKGTMTYDISFRVDRQGEYLSGVTTAQCAYAPEFSAHTGALHIVVK